MPFTEFYCIPISGSNTNAGSTTEQPIFCVSGGGWNSGAGDGIGPFYSCSGTQDITMIQTGMFGAISTGSINRVVVLGIVTGIDEIGKAISFHSTKLLGRCQTMSGADVRLTIGGPWEGPQPTGGPLSAGFPINFMSGGMRNNSGDLVRINLQNSTQYNITGYSISSSFAGPVLVQGYSQIPGDSGKAVISASGHILFNMVSMINWSYSDIVFQNNSTTGSSHLIVMTSVGPCLYNRCKFVGSRGGCINTNSNMWIVESEFTDWNKFGGISRGAIEINNGNTIIDRCYFHDATGINAIAIDASLNVVLLDSIIARVDGDGIVTHTQPAVLFIKNVDFYKIGRHAIRNAQTSLSNGGMIFVRDSNFFECSGFMYNDRGATIVNYNYIQNCAFGSGIYGFSSGILNSNSYSGGVELDCITYPSGQTPWNNPTNSDFRITHPLALNAGRRSFPISTGNAIIPRPDVGSIQHVGFPIGMIR